MERCPACQATTLVTDGSRVSCDTCGIVIDEAPMSNEITFTESSNGASKVQGAFLSHDQNRPRYNGPPGMHASQPGESRAATVQRASNTINGLAQQFHIGTVTRDKAVRIFKTSMAGRDKDGSKINFVLGRNHHLTVASCLYVACRRDRLNVMLIDFAQALNLNVFELGRSYLRLLRCIGPDTNDPHHIIDPVIYIGRFCAMLDFGTEANKVAKDATLLVKRFKFDWISQGRRPAGVCGAAILLAARMNNFRRSVAEVVQVVKIADVTLRKRLEEFKNTPSASLSVEDFRHVWLEQESNPPSFFINRETKRKRIEKKERLARKALKLAQQKQASPGDADADGKDQAAATDAASSSRKGKERADAERDGDDEDEGDEDEDDDDDDDIDLDDTVDPGLDALATEATELEVRGALNEEGIRELDAELEESEKERIRKAKLGRLGPYRAPPKEGEVEEPTPTAPASQALLESQNAMSQREYEEQQRRMLEGSKADAKAAAAASQKRSKKAKAKGGHATNEDERAGTDAESAAEDAPPPEENFWADLDDKELDTYLLTPQQAALKERVWVEFNKDYLERELTKHLKEEADIKAGIPIKKKIRRNKKKNAGLHHHLAGDTAAASVRNMVEQKGPKISKKLNYNVLGKLLGNDYDLTRAADAGVLSDEGLVNDSDAEFDEEGNRIIVETGPPSTDRRVRKESADVHRQKKKASRARQDKHRKRSKERGSGASGTDTELDAGGRLSEAESAGGTTTEAETDAGALSAVEDEEQRRQKRLERKRNQRLGLAGDEEDDEEDEEEEEDDFGVDNNDAF